eukprot:jgi/Mesen1/6503/ME000332S05515
MSQAKRNERRQGRLVARAASSSQQLSSPSGGAGAAEAEEEEGGPATPCDECDSRGWVLCSFCEGQKVNVQVRERSNKFYRRCPECKA